MVLFSFIWTFVFVWKEVCFPCLWNVIIPSQSPGGELSPPSFYAASRSASRHGSISPLCKDLSYTVYSVPEPTELCQGHLLMLKGHSQPFLYCSQTFTFADTMSFMYCPAGRWHLFRKPTRLFQGGREGHSTFFPVTSSLNSFSCSYCLFPFILNWDVFPSVSHSQRRDDWRKLLSVTVTALLTPASIWVSHASFHPIWWEVIV